MKTVYLVRHAKSSWNDPDLEDFERPLNKRGRKSALLMGTVLKKLEAAPDLVISSPANRAAMTARMLADAIRYPLEKIQYSETIYLSDENVLIRFLRNIKDSVNQAMLIGHNPGLTELVNYIGDQRINNIPTGGVCCIDLKITSWKDIREHGGQLRFFEFPKKHVS
jgi:phosphohistidine phosphatase